MRLVVNLRRAEFRLNGPTLFKQTRGRSGARARGLAYEKAIAKILERSCPAGTRLLVQPWIFFEDSYGNGFARPDIVAEGKTSVILFECKLTESDTTDLQMAQKYVPLLSYIYPGRPISRIGVYRHLRYEPIRPIEDPWLLLHSPAERFHTWHVLT